MARLLRMPAVAANAVEALLTEWPVAENVPFTADDAIATVETEKAVVDIPADADGVILKTLVASGAAVKVGTPIALLGDPGETVGDLDALLAEFGVDRDGVAPAADASPVVDAPPPATASPAPAPAVVDAAPPTFVPVAVAPPGGGAVPQAVVPEVPDVPDPPAAVPAAVGAAPRTAVPPEVPDAVAAGAAGAAPGGPGRTFASPLARRMAREAGLSIDDLTGTGPDGRIVRVDVQRALAARESPGDGSGPPRESAVDLDASRGEPATPPAAPATTQPAAAGAACATAGYEDVPHSRMRRAIATRLTGSARDIPHFSVRGTARVDRLLRLRARLNEAGPAKVSINDLVVMAAARAHGIVPAMNVIWTPDAARSFSSVDIAIAVATDRGIVTPVLRGVDGMLVSAVAAATGDLIARARTGRLRQAELEGGTLTVTNLGGYGTEDFTAIINPPQSAILAVGAARREPVAHKERLAVGTVMRVTLSVDHRPIDGAVAAQWMAAFLGLVEDPLRILA